MEDMERLTLMRAFMGGMGKQLEAEQEIARRKALAAIAAKK